MNVEFLMKLHDEEIFDWLEAEINDDAAEKFTGCLLDPIQYTPEQVVEICNATLIEVGSNLRIVEYAGKNDDGYFWRVKDVSVI